MGKDWTPPIAPDSGEQDVYLILDNLSRNGRVLREAHAEAIDAETVISDLLSGQYCKARGDRECPGRRTLDPSSVFKEIREDL